MKTSATRIVVPCRLSYAHIWEPSENLSGQSKYSASLIIPKSDTQTLARVNNAIQAAIEMGKHKLVNARGVLPAQIKTPLRDADAEGIDDKAYQGCMYFTASSNRQPQIVDRHVQPILDRSEVYSGCYCKVSVNFYAFAVEVNKGIAAGLNNIQKLRDGERLGGAPSAEEEFEDITDEELAEYDEMFR